VGEAGFEVVWKLRQLSLYWVPRPIPWISERKKGRESSHIPPYYSNHTIVDLNIWGNPATLKGKEIILTIYYIHVCKSLPHLVQTERLNKQNRGENRILPNLLNQTWREGVKASCRHRFSITQVQFAIFNDSLRVTLSEAHREMQAKLGDLRGCDDDDDDARNLIKWSSVK
jgi:hypothetical protein